jgi:hypothetical protein
MAWCSDPLFDRRRLLYPLLLVLAAGGILACIGVAAWTYVGISLDLSFDGRMAQVRSIPALVFGPAAAGVIF